MPKIVYDRVNCEGSFVCSAQAPGDFEENDEEDKVDLVDGQEVARGIWEKTIDEDEIESAKAAAEGCPIDVIKVLDDEGNVVEGPAELPIEQ